MSMTKRERMYQALAHKPVDKIPKGELRDGPTTSLSGNALMTRPHIKTSPYGLAMLFALHIPLANTY